MNNKKYQYSVKLIIRNKMGLLLLFYICFSLLALLNSYFLNSKYKYYYLIIIGLISCLIFFAILLINISKIRKYFINGILVDGFILKREEINQKLNLGIFYPQKFIIFYRYNIHGEIYSSSSKIRDKKDLAYLKENTEIKILVNPNNKNDAIILDIYKK